MEEGPDVDLDLEQPPLRTADLLIRIAGILNLDPSFFLDERRGAAPRDAIEREDLLRLFHAIDDADTRRAALNLLRLLQAPSRDA